MTSKPKEPLTTPSGEIIIRLSQAESEAFAQSWRARLMRQARTAGAGARELAAKAKGEI